MAYIQLKKPDGVWVTVAPGDIEAEYDYPEINWQTVPLCLKTSTGWAEQAFARTPNSWTGPEYARGPLLKVKDPGELWQPVTKFWTPEQLAPHPAVWVTAEDMDVRDGDRVWEMRSQIPDGPPLIDGFLFIEGDELTEGTIYQDDDPPTYWASVPAVGKQIRRRYDVDGRPAALSRSHLGDEIPFEERLEGVLFAPYWAEDDTHYSRRVDLIHGLTEFVVFRLLGTGFFIELSDFASWGVGTYFNYFDDEREILHSAYRYDGKYIEHFNYNDDFTQFPDERPLLDKLYVLETTAHFEGGFTQRLNGQPLSYANIEYDMWPSDAGNSPRTGDFFDVQFMEFECATTAQNTYEGDKGWYLYEYKVWSGELTGQALADERAYFSTKYGVPT